MLIAAALRALAPFSLIAGKPVFHMLGLSLANKPQTEPSTPRRSRKATALAAALASNDGQHAARVHCFMQASTQAASLRSSAQQLSLLDDSQSINSNQSTIADAASAVDATEVLDRPLNRIRLPRKPALRRRTTAARSTTTSPTCLPVQRCSAQAANDATIKMYWAKPKPVQRQRGMRWAMSGTMADIFAELERLERLERTQAAVY